MILQSFSSHTISALRRISRVSGHGCDAPALGRAISQSSVTLNAPLSYHSDDATLRKYSERTARELAAFETILVDGKLISIARAATEAVVDAAKADSLLVIGEPGSGKSAVVSAAAAALRSAKTDVVQFAV